jgi:hypothetical protein
MLPLGLDAATQTDIAFVAIWFIGFPALVTGLVLFAIVQARGEERRYAERRRHTPLEPPHAPGRRPPD